MNCGCPQRWAIQDGYGCYLLTRPQLVCDMVKETKQRVGNEFPVEIKIRIDKNERSVSISFLRLDYLNDVFLHVMNVFKTSLVCYGCLKYVFCML